MCFLPREGPTHAHTVRVPGVGWGQRSAGAWERLMSPGSERGLNTGGLGGSGTLLHLHGPTLRSLGSPGPPPWTLTSRPRGEALRPVWAPSMGLAAGTSSRGEAQGPWGTRA